MRIAYITPGCGISGGIAVICQHATRLQNRGHEVFLLSLEPPLPMDWFPNQTVPIVYVKEWVGHLDIVVATGWSTTFYLPCISATVKCYFVQSDETRFFEKDSRWQHLATLTYYFGVHYLTEAKWIQRWLKENFGHCAELVPNGLDERIFYPTIPLQPRGLRPRVLLEGAIVLPYKGMAEAFAVVCPLDVEVWCISSAGVPNPEWRCDRFFEHVPMIEMSKIYSSCDILIKLSRVEGFFGPPMEMMACGGVAVVGRVTGYDEYIVDGYNAMVVDVDDADAIREAVKKLINDKNLKSKLIANGLATAAKWKWNDSIDLLERYYSSLLSEHECSTDCKRRWQYDSSLSYAYDYLSTDTRAGPVPLPGSEAGDIPHDAVVLGRFLMSTRVFWRISATVGYLYRLVQNIRRLI